MKQYFALAFVLATSATAMGSIPKLLDAMRYVESGNQESPPDGDGGRSIGPYQIQYAYWYDATHNSRGEKIIAGEYADCRNRAYAERIILSYWQRYAKAALQNGNYEVLARIHNGGPQGHRKKATLPYWEKVKNRMEQCNTELETSMMRPKQPGEVHRVPTNNRSHSSPHSFPHIATVLPPHIATGWLSMQHQS